MSLGVTQSGLKIITHIPLEPFTQAEDHTKVELSEQDFLQVGRCVCWELLALVSSLRNKYEDIEQRICHYHRELYQKRTGPDGQHHCPCHHQRNRSDFCWNCGYCHNCGCDSVTTSTPRFHRCTCDLCLHRCCGLFGTTDENRSNARARHNLYRIKQLKERCQSGTKPINIRSVPTDTAYVRPIPPAQLPRGEVKAIATATSLNPRQPSAGSPPASPPATTQHQPPAGSPPASPPATNQSVRSPLSANPCQPARSPPSTNPPARSPPSTNPCPPAGPPPLVFRANPRRLKWQSDRPPLTPPGATTIRQHRPAFWTLAPSAAASRPLPPTPPPLSPPVMPQATCASIDAGTPACTPNYSVIDANKIDSDCETHASSGPTTRQEHNEDDWDY